MEQTTDAALRRLMQEATECLTENILPFWLDKMQDREHGGWYGRMDGHGLLHPQAEKGAILNARLLWSLSAAYRVLRSEGNSSHQELCRRCLVAATMTKDYFLRHFVDHEQGGVYWSVDHLGRPLETKKQTYAIGFAVYGLSEYARATGSTSDPASTNTTDLPRHAAEALQAAIHLTEDIQRHAWDPAFGGYIEACTRDWHPIADMRLSDKDENYPKSQNTHLHVIEPFTNLLRACQELSLEAPSCNSPSREALRLLCRDLIAAQQTRVAALISLFTGRLLNPATQHLDLFFQLDWTRTGTTASYGHDIECSWLLHEAALVLGDAAVLREVEPVVQQVAQASEEGLVRLSPLPLPYREGSIYLQEQGPSTHPAQQEGDAVWWVQAEAVVGFLNLYQHFGDRTALTKVLGLWNFIKSHLVDHELGEWFWSVRAENNAASLANRGTAYQINRDDDHAGFWKCPYHNSRMCLEIIERCKDMLK